MPNPVVNESTNDDDRAAIRNLVERVCADDRFQTGEAVYLRLFYCDGMTFRQLADILGQPLGTAHRHFKRAQHKMAAVVIEMVTDPDELRDARRLLSCLRETHGRKGGSAPADVLPEFVPVRTAARLCGVDSEKVRAWMADPQHPVKSQRIEKAGRMTECVPLNTLPLLDEFRYDYRSLKARIVTEDDLVTWRLIARVAA